MSVDSRVSIHAMSIKRSDLEELLEHGDPDPNAPVHVEVEPRFNSPTDPGGAITISMRGRVD